jgi:hypothetical protein
VIVAVPLEYPFFSSAIAILRKLSTALSRSFSPSCSVEGETEPVASSALILASPLQAVEWRGYQLEATRAEEARSAPRAYGSGGSRRLQEKAKSAAAEAKSRTAQ